MNKRKLLWENELEHCLSGNFELSSMAPIQFKMTQELLGSHGSTEPSKDGVIVPAPATFEDQLLDTGNRILNLKEWALMMF